VKPRMLIRKGPNHPWRSETPKARRPAVTLPTAQLDRTAVVRTRMPGGVGGEEPRGSPLSPCVPSMFESWGVQVPCTT
jgi:hypothetical protein